MMWTNVDHPEMSEGWAFPKPEAKCHYFRNGRSLCGRCTIPESSRTGGRLDAASADDCLTCGDIALAEVIRDWCEHGDPPGKCPECDEGGVA